LRTPYRPICRTTIANPIPKLAGGTAIGGPLGLNFLRKGRPMYQKRFSASGLLKPKLAAGRISQVR